ncbi:hypothetical protein [Modestobacter italicus]|uniref:hypothetical protein n=1 Tax=Modestobacter italicus (strain DSM 44449 / CECT 9708 / BC 501) TaxID=2732864 RepID=UPI001FE735A9|nr:hypothetical protein [Modestobacter italicus]
MVTEQFSQQGHEVVDWIPDYWSRVSSLPARSQVSPGDVRAALSRGRPTRVSRSPRYSPTSTGASSPA